MSAQFEISTEEFQAALQALPETLARAAGAALVRHAESAASKIRAAYPADSGELKNSVKVTYRIRPFGASATIWNTASYAKSFEFGTEVRLYQGASRGRMRPGHVFLPIVDRERRAAMAEVADLIKAHGLQVTGA